MQLYIKADIQDLSWLVQGLENLSQVPVLKKKWRWVRDSNPGTAINRRRFSRPLH